MNTIWNDKDHPEWVELSKRIEPFLDRLTGRDDLAVIIEPNLASGDAGKVKPMPAGAFYPDFARMEFNASEIFDKSLGDVQYVYPERVLSQRAFPKLTGVIVHEASHAKHSLHDFPKETPRQIMNWVMVLEETRAERQMLEEFPQYTRYIRVIVKEIVSAGIESITVTANDVLNERIRMARTAILLLGRETIGVFEDFEMDEIRDQVTKVLGKKDFNELQKLWVEAQNLDDDESEKIIPIAEKIELLINPDQEETAGIVSFSCSATPSGAPQAPNSNVKVIADTLNEIAGNALDEIAAEAYKGTVKPPVNQSEINARHREAAAQSASKVPNDPKTSRSGGYDYYAAVATSSTPTATDISRSRAITLALQKAQYRDVTRTTLDSMVPPGRLNIRQAMNRDSQVAARQVVTATPWKQTRRRTVDNPPLTFAVATDVSASMTSWQYEVSSFTWAVANAVKKLQGKVAAVAWNTTPLPLIKPNQVRSDQITSYKANGGSTGCPEAINALDGMLDLSFSEGVRVLCVLTDDELPNMNEVHERIQKLSTYGVHVLWVVTGGNKPAPKGALRVKLDRPDDFGRIVGAKLVELLQSA